MLEQPDHRDHKDLPDQMVLLDHKDHKDLPDQMVLLDLLAQADQVALEDPVLGLLIQQHLDKLQFTMAQHQ